MKGFPVTTNPHPLSIDPDQRLLAHTASAISELRTYGTNVANDIAVALTRAAANVGGIDSLLPEVSPQADLVIELIRSVAGRGHSDLEYSGLLPYRTAPLYLDLEPTDMTTELFEAAFQEAEEASDTAYWAALTSVITPDELEEVEQNNQKYLGDSVFFEIPKEVSERMADLAKGWEERAAATDPEAWQKYQDAAELVDEVQALHDATATQYAQSLAEAGTKCVLSLGGSFPVIVDGDALSDRHPSDDLFDLREKVSDYAYRNALHPAVGHALNPELPAEPGDREKILDLARHNIEARKAQPIQADSRPRDEFELLPPSPGSVKRAFVAFRVAQGQVREVAHWEFSEYLRQVKHEAHQAGVNDALTLQGFAIRAGRPEFAAGKYSQPHPLPQPAPSEPTLLLPQHPAHSQAPSTGIGF